MAASDLSPDDWDDTVRRCFLIFDRTSGAAGTVVHVYT